MTDQKPPAKEEQIARARRLREQIQRLKEKRPASGNPDESPGKSLKEQIEERAAEPANPGDRE